MFKHLTSATLCLMVMSSAAMACSADDVQAKQGALLTAVQELLKTDPAKAQALVLEMQTKMAEINENNDEAAVCVLMDRLTAEAAG